MHYRQWRRGIETMESHESDSGRAGNALQLGRRSGKPECGCLQHLALGRLYLRPNQNTCADTFDKLPGPLWHRLYASGPQASEQFTDWRQQRRRFADDVYVFGERLRRRVVHFSEQPYDWKSISFWSGFHSAMSKNLQFNLGL